ncbi:Uncharacterised protein [Mycobacteroides abscessus subsp. massiliense]|nr:Uncharacterised protein [Mycobacteroides abscessus subsp. massiliense]
MQPIHRRPPDSTTPVTVRRSRDLPVILATTSPVSGFTAMTHGSVSVLGSRASGSRHSTLRIAGDRGSNHSASALRGLARVIQIRPSAPVLMLSGMPGISSTIGVSVPAAGPVSAYLLTRRPTVSAMIKADPSAVIVTPLVKASPVAMVVTVPSGSRRNTRPVGRPSRMAAMNCSNGKRAVDSLK